MNYNESLESGNNELFTFIKDLLSMNVDGNELRVKDITITQPNISSNYCMSINKTYAYTINVIIECISGEIKGQTASVSFEIPKMVENNYVMHSGGLQAKFKTPITVGEFLQVIRRNEGKIYTTARFSIYPDLVENKYGVMFPALRIYTSEDEDGILTYDLQSYLISKGVNYDEVMKYVPSGKGERITDAKDIVIPDWIYERFSKKFFQLTGTDLSSPVMTGDNLFELIKLNKDYPEKYDLYSPFDINFMSDFMVMIKELSLHKYEIKDTIQYQTAQNLRKGVFRINLNKMIRMMARHYQAKTDLYQTIQSSSESNAATSISQSHKIYLMRKNISTKKYEQIPLKYTDDFIGIICPFKSPEGNQINMKNEFARHVNVRNGEAFVQVRNKSNEVVELNYMDYYRSKILSRTNYDYRKHKVLPTAGCIEYLYRGEYVREKYVSDDQFDYVRVDEVSMLAYNTTLVPFVNQNDSVRIAMSTNMLDQAIPVSGGGRTPLMTGTEIELYDKSDFNIKSNVSGTVLGVFDSYIKVQKEGTEEIEIIKVPEPTITSDHTYNRHSVAVQVGQKITPKTVVARSNSFTPGGVLAIKVPARIAYINYEGYDHEDGIIMRDGFRKNFAHTMDKVVDIYIQNSTRFKFDRDELVTRCSEVGLHLDKLEEIKKLNEFGLPNVGDKFNQGEALASYIEELDPNKMEIARLNKMSKKSNLARVVVRNTPFLVNDGIVTKVEVLINPKTNYLSHIREYYEELERTADAKLREFLGDKEVIHKTSFDFSKYSGVIRIHIRYDDIPEVGDKFSNLFGSKGTITKIIADDEAPISSSTGLPIDVIFAPDSSWSRKNPSQVKSSYLGQVGVVSKQLGTKYLKNKEYDKLRELLNAIHVTDDYTDYSEDDLIKYDKDSDPRFYTLYADSLDNKYGLKALELIEKVTGLSMDNKEFYYLPKYRKKTDNPITFGTESLIRLHFKAADKLKATSAIYTGDEFVLGPGQSKMGGQKLGEMEIWSLLANNTVEVYEHLTGTDITAQSTQSIKSAMFLMGLVLQPEETLSTGDDEVPSESND